MRLITLTAIAGGGVTVTTATVTLTTTDGSAAFSDSVEDFSSYVGRRVTFVDGASKEAAAYISEVSGSNYLLVSSAYGTTRNMESVEVGFSAVGVASVVVDDEFMFDGITDTQTETAEEIQKTFSVAGFNSLAILNCYGIEASLEIGGTTQTISLIRDSITDWWDYWFAASRIGGDFVFYFPTQLAGTDATLTISYPGGTAKCGLCITGVAQHIMYTGYDIKIGISDYSRIATDGFGRTYLLQGRFAKRADVGGIVYNINFDQAYREIVKNRSVACVFDYNEYTQTLNENHTSVDAYQSLIVYGFTEDFYENLNPGSASTMKHESQGLT